MKFRPLWPALVLVLAINALVLTGVARNRAGAPESSLTLTERELPLNIDSYHQENSGVALRLVWNRSYGIDEWFDVAKLNELGIVSPDMPGKSDAFRRSLPKKAFVVLEYEGAAWLRFKAEKEQELTDLKEKLRQEKIDEQNAKSQRHWIERALQVESRLFAVDAGVDPRQLRQRYPDNHRYPIMAVSVRATSDYKNQQKIPRGMVDTLLVAKLHVPRELHAPLLELPPTEPFTGYRFDQPGKIPRPRYEVQVEWGQRYEPWVTEVRLIGEDSTE